MIRKFTVMSVIALAPVFPGHAAMAGEGARAIEEVVVTARRREESLQEVPVAVTSLSGEDLLRSGITTTDDIDIKTPSLTFIQSSSRGVATPYVSIRGLRNFDIAITIDPAVAFYFDEVAQQRPNGVTQTIYDIESIQVLKGPQGTLFGRNTTGGAILINSKKPTTDAMDGYVQVSGGNLSYKDVEGAVNIPFSDTVALRLAGKWTERDGYMTNLITGQDTNDQDYYSFRGRLLIEPNDNFRTLFSGSVFKEDSNGIAQLALDPYRGFAAALFSSPIPGDPRSLADDYAAGDGDSYDFLSDQILQSKADVYDVSNVTEFDFDDTFLGNITLKNILGWREVETNSVYDFDGTQFSMVWLNGNTKVEQWSEELQISGGNERMDWIGGVYYFNEDGTDNNYNLVGLSSALRTTLPPVLTVEDALSGNYPTQLTGNEAENESMSVFAHFSFNLTDALKLSVGGRYTRDKRQSIVIGLGTGLVNCRLVDDTGALLPNDACFFDDSKTFKEPTYNISLDYQLTDDMLLYVAHRHGYRSGGWNNRALTPASAGPFDAETVDDIEIGFKTDFAFGNTVGRFNAAAYFSDYTDIQRTQSYVQPGTTAFVSNIINAAGAELWGLELELTLQPTEQLTFNAFYSFNDAKYTDWEETDPGSGVTTDRSDNDWDFMPKHKVGASVRYDIPLGQGDGMLGLQADFYHQAKTNVEVINNDFGWRPGYELLNLRADWTQVMGSDFDLALFANNVTDEYYYQGGNANGSIGLNTFMPGPPRTYGVQVKYSFSQ